MKRAHVIGVVVVALGLARASGASAQAPAARPPFELAWLAPAGCPDHAAVVARVERMLTRPASAASGGALSIAARVQPGPPWHLQLAIAGRDGSTTRELDDQSCERLADATALMIAMAVDPDADGAAEPAGANAAPAPATPPPATPMRTATPPTTTRPPVLDTERIVADEARRRVREPPRTALTLGLGLVADLGILPGLGTGAEVRVGLARGGLRLALRGDAWPVRSTPDGAARIGVALYSLGAQGCYVPTRGALEFRVCGAFDAGYMAAVDGGAAAGQSAGAAWAAMFAELGLAWRPARWVAFRLELGPGVTLARPRFVDLAPSHAVVFEPSTVVGRGALTIELTL